MSSTMIGDQKYGYGAYMICNERLKASEIGKSRPREMHARRPDRKVSFGGLVLVEKNSKCFWNGVYELRDMVLESQFGWKDSERLNQSVIINYRRAIVTSSIYFVWFPKYQQNIRAPLEIQ